MQLIIELSSPEKILFRKIYLMTKSQFDGMETYALNTHRMTLRGLWYDGCKLNVITVDDNDVSQTVTYDSI